MAKKSKAPLWRGRFLRALRRSANVRLAARVAGVDHSSAYALRKRDAEFAARWERAVQAGSGKAAARPAGPLHRTSCAWGRDRVPRTRSSTAGGSRKPTRPPRSGEELVVRRSKNAGSQLVRAGAGRWSAKAEAVFFVALGATACVRRSAEAAGFSTTAVYNRRKADPEFRAKWQAALEEAQASLHMMVVGAGIAAFQAGPENAEGDGPKATLSEAIAILRLKGVAAASGTAGPGGGERHGIEEPSIDQVRDEVLRRLAALRRQRSDGGGAGEEG